MSIFKRAKELAAMGFYVFPLKENGKTPIVKEFTDIAVNDPNDLKKFWFDEVLELEHYYNIGIATTKFQDGALLVVDVDNKNGKCGSDTILKLELEGKDFPKTLTQKTPTGGMHLIYRCKKAVKQGTNVLGDGLDIRSRGGYILGAGSIINDIKYKINKVKIAQAPDWIIELCNKGILKERKSKKATIKVSQKGAKIRAKDYLATAPLAIEGSGGDQTTFVIANKLKDMGLTEKNCLKLMLDNWNDRCSPPWDAKDLQGKINNAYAYGQNKIGVDSPENDFSPIVDAEETPIDDLNKEFSFIVLGGKSAILRQKDNGEVSYMTTQAFHDLLKSKVVLSNNGRKLQLSEVWFASPKRASYNSAELHPAQDAPEGVYNLWRGFKCEPLAPDEAPTKSMLEGVRLFKEHALENICLGDKDLYNWLMGYFAHLIQRPWEKPLTALVFKGDKGVGKNALIDRIGRLFNGHYLLTSNKRYITSNFNKHLANLILFVLDEAFWSGDKQAEGILKDLITGNTHLIEHKGREMFSAKNVLRLCIIGNEDWVVPASKDERRYAVFNIGNSRQGDKKYFTKMRRLIDKKGGNRLLMRELLDFDLNSVDVNAAPNTVGLLEQKIESLNPIHSWWYSCLEENTILGIDFQNDWPSEVGRTQLRDAYVTYAKQRGIKSWLPDSSAFGRTFKKCIPSVHSTRSRGDTGRLRSYSIPDLKQARIEFEAFIRHKIEWADDDINSNVLDATHLFN